MNEPNKKRVKKRKKIDRQARIRHLKMIKIGAVAAVLILIISVIAILNPFGHRDGISIDKEDIETETNINDKFELTPQLRKNYGIIKVIEIKLNNETSLDVVRSNIYEHSAIGISTKDTSILKVYTRNDVTFYEYRREHIKDERNSDVKQDRTRSSNKTKESYERENEIIYEDIKRFRTIGDDNQGNNSNGLEQSRNDEQNGGLYRKESSNNRNTNDKQSNGNIQYSLKIGDDTNNVETEKIIQFSSLIKKITR